MGFVFVDKLPSKQGRTTNDNERAEELIDEMLANPGKWAKVPYEWLYPNAEGLTEKKLIERARNLSNRIHRREIRPFSDYPCECCTRKTDFYIRINATKRQLKEMGF